MSNNAADARTPPPESAEALGGRWVWPPLILALTAALIWWLGRGGPHPEASAAAHSAPAGEAAVDSLPTWPDLGAFFKKAPPSKVELSIPERGMEVKLLAFIEDASKPVDKETWFDFDRLLFDTGSAKLRSPSMEQLRNIAEILKAYPEVDLAAGDAQVGAAPSRVRSSWRSP